MDRRFFFFCGVGVAGFLVNAGFVYAARPSIGPYAAGVFAWVAAATTTWWLNRVWTFQSPDRSGLLQQWAKFLVANAVGFVFYFVAFASLTFFISAFAAYPILAVGAGSLSGLLVNYQLSNRIVFAKKRQKPFDTAP